MTPERQPVSFSPSALNHEQESAISRIRGSRRPIIIDLLTKARGQGQGVPTEKMIDALSQATEIDFDPGPQELKSLIGRAVNEIDLSFRPVGLSIHRETRYDHDAKRYQTTYYLLTEEEKERMFHQKESDLDQRNGYLTVPEIAEQVGVTASLCFLQCKQMTNKGSISPHHLDRRRPTKIFFSPEDVQEVAAVLEKKAQHPAPKNGRKPPQVNESESGPSEDDKSDLRSDKLATKFEHSVMSKPKEEIIEDIGQSATAIILSHLKNGIMENLTHNLDDFLTPLLPTFINRHITKITIEDLAQGISHEEFFINLFTKTLKELWEVDQITPKDAESKKRSIGYCLELKKKDYAQEQIISEVKQHFSFEVPEGVKQPILAAA